jgi:hypothetical protein
MKNYKNYSDKIKDIRALHMHYTDKVAKKILAKCLIDKILREMW